MSAFSEWWQRIAKAYNVRANLHLNGNEYGKYGTTFDVQLLVIDKTGQTPGDNWKEQLENIVWSDAATIEDADLWPDAPIGSSHAARIRFAFNRAWRGEAF